MKRLLLMAGAFALPVLAMAQDVAVAASYPMVGPIRVEFILFALTLLGVALLHNHTLKVALVGVSAVLAFKLLLIPDFDLMHHLMHEWRTFANLLGLLLGFAILAKHFEESGVPQILPKYLPDGWKGGFVLLVLIAIISSFLDNIAAAMIGGAIASVVFKGKVHIGYLAAIVAASNAGGAGSVVGDTTTTMMWIAGVSALDVTHAFVGSIVAICIFGIIAAFQQDKYQRIQADADPNAKIDVMKLVVVALILAGAIATNILLDFPAVGVWVAILAGALLTKTPWDEVKHAIGGTVFLLSLVMCASLMPVEELPAASWQTAFGLGFVSAVFDNIPLTALAINQGGYDWGVLAFSVGFGGSMIWFGSSAGVAISNMYPEAKSVANWLKGGWHVAVGYVIGFMVMLFVVGWHPHAPHKSDSEAGTEVAAPAHH
jgi:Na+/H+ antiporter NhaD/arsenite permease-like protein